MTIRNFELLENLSNKLGEKTLLEAFCRNITPSEMNVILEKIEREHEVKLPYPEVTAAGGYPIFYTDFQGEVICGICAPREEVSQSTERIHWEGESLECDYCHKEIESAYGPNKGEVK